MNNKLKECSGRLRKFVSAVQGAPYPGTVSEELYAIWYEHIQQDVLDCLEYLDTHFPLENQNADIEKTLKKAFPSEK